MYQRKQFKVCVIHLCVSRCRRVKMVRVGGEISFAADYNEFFKVLQSPCARVMTHQLRNIDLSFF